MRKKIFLLLALIITPLSAFAADATFTASIESDHVVAGEGFTLQLSLSGANPKDSPDLTLLSSSFEIESQGNTSETSIINGHISSSLGWQLMLVAKQTGHLTIPSLSIETDEGRLATQPVTLDVDAAQQSSSQPSISNAHAGRDVLINALISNDAPYQNQPVIYTVRIITHVDIADLSLGDVKADNAIVKPLGKPVSSDTLQNGIQTKIIDVRYLVTPVQDGPITIAPITLHGSIESDTAAMPSAMSHNGYIDPMAMLQQMGHFSDFMSRKPFSIVSNAVTINVKAPVASVTPWLPLKELRIEEQSDLPSLAKVGEPLTRKFTLIADGMDGSQLPSLESQLQSGDVKIYADKPKTDEEFDSDTGDIVGHREESYSIIPLKAGTLALPAVKLAWWDTKNNHIAYAEAPAHKIDVLQGTTPGITNATQPPNSSLLPAPTQQTANPEATTRQIPPLWYGLVILLLMLIATMIIVALWLRNQVIQLKGGGGKPVKENPVTGRASASHMDIKWEDIHTADDLKRCLQFYSHRRWNTPLNASIESTFMQEKDNLLNKEDSEQLYNIVHELSAALYAGKTIDLEDIKKKCRRILVVMDKPTAKKNISEEKLPGLNPS